MRPPRVPGAGAASSAADANDIHRVHHLYMAVYSPQDAADADHRHVSGTARMRLPVFPVADLLSEVMWRTIVASAKCFAAGFEGRRRKMPSSSPRSCL